MLSPPLKTVIALCNFQLVFALTVWLHLCQLSCRPSCPRPRTTPLPAYLVRMIQDAEYFAEELGLANSEGGSGGLYEGALEGDYFDPDGPSEQQCDWVNGSGKGGAGYSFGPARSMDVGSEQGYYSKQGEEGPAYEQYEGGGGGSTGGGSYAAAYQVQLQGGPGRGLMGGTSSYAQLYDSDRQQFAVDSSGGDEAWAIAAAAPSCVPAPDALARGRGAVELRCMMQEAEAHINLGLLPDYYSRLQQQQQQSLPQPRLESYEL